MASDEPNAGGRYQFAEPQLQAWFVPLEGTLSTDALAQPANWAQYATDLSPYLIGPIRYGPGDEAAGD